MSSPRSGHAQPAALIRSSTPSVVEFSLDYPGTAWVKPGVCHPDAGGSTHEIAFDPKGGKTLWITGQNYDSVVRVTESGAATFFPMATGSGPHGIEFDASGQLWVSLEFSGQIVRLDDRGRVTKSWDVRLDCPTCTGDHKINPHPHGMGFGPDGKTIWFTGKSTGTVGKVAPDGKVTTYVLPTVGSVPIYVRAGRDGTMWVTELVGNQIALITPSGDVHEIAIPTHNSRPIAIVPEPGSNAMWFSEEAGNRVGRVTWDGTCGKIVEYPVPKKQSNVILAGLAFDSAHHLWVQQYVDQNNPTPEGSDFIVKLDRSILTTSPGDVSKVPVTYYKVPSTKTIMHRIVQGPDGNIWFTELGVNKVGKLSP